MDLLRSGEAERPGKFFFTHVDGQVLSLKLCLRPVPANEQLPEVSMEVAAASQQSACSVAGPNMGNCLNAVNDFALTAMLQ